MGELAEKAYIFGMIFTLSNKLQIIGDRFDESLTVKQWLLLAGIFKSGRKSPSIGEVAALIGSSRQNVKKMAAILEKAGFVALYRDAGDARVTRIELTTRCYEHLKKRDEQERRFLEELFTGFEEKELADFARALTKLEKNIRGMGNDDEETE